MSYTPGPWKYETDMVGGGWESDTLEISISAGETLIATYETSHVEYPSNAECEANARLIAAAPEAAELLEKILNSDMAQFAEDEGQKVPELDAARALLARIKGE